MKHLNIIWFYVTVLMLVTSCADDSLLSFQVDKPESIAAQETINKYGFLKDYVDRDENSDFKLGVGVTLSDYTDQGVMYRLVNNDFDEMTLGYAMKHGAVVQSDGSLDLEDVNDLITLAKAAGVTVFGHTLCWHSNQNATYLNTTIGPLTVTAPSIANSLDLSGLEDGTFKDWGIDNSGSGISIAKGEGMVDGTNAIKLVASSSSSSAEALQLVSPDIDVVSGHSYVVILYIKSDAEGEGRVSFNGLSDNTPSEDWMDTGTSTETFSTDIWWQKVEFEISDFEEGTFNLKLDLGYQLGVTYYVDINNLYIYDTKGEAALVNLVDNGDFEDGNITGWNGWGNSSTRVLSADGDGYGNTGYCLEVTNPTTASAYYSVQTSFALDESLEQGEQYTLSFYAKCTDDDGSIIPEMQSDSWTSGSDGFGTVYLKTSWAQYSVTVTPTVATRNHLVISYGNMVGTVYLDNVKLYKTAGSSLSEDLSIEKSDEAKAKIVGSDLESWISQMVENCKDYVTAWDVVNEPMDDSNPYELKTSDGDDDDDEFYWQDYLGKDYAVDAFKLAREYGNDGDLLFINDYNLEYNIDKCKGLIQYVEYVDNKLDSIGIDGIDGIGTQMHISTTSDKDNITEMFTLLAATGKLIKISELDIRIGDGTLTADATDDDYEAQSEMYQYIVEKYFEIIPAAQRYGITVWSPLDSPEGSSWRADEPIGLWSIDYVRKPAYAGFANGLAGEDVSAGFE